MFGNFSGDLNNGRLKFGFHQNLDAKGKWSLLTLSWTIQIPDTIVRLMAYELLSNVLKS